MFGSQTRFFVVFGVCVACASVAFATQHRFSGEFTETREGYPNAYTTGTFYYLYDDANVSKSVLRFNYVLPTMNIDNLYYYPFKAQYSMCDTTCTAETINEIPDKWWYDSSVYVLNSTEPGSSLKWYIHKKVNKTNQVSRILMSDDNQPSAQLKIEKIEFNDGRTIVIKPNSLKYNDPNVPASSDYFKPNKNVHCPEPTCSMFADIVFVLDYSGSVGKDGWTKTYEFVIGVMQSFSFGDQAAAAACIQFNGPSYYTNYTQYRKKVKCDPKKSGDSNNVYRAKKDYPYVSDAGADRTASILAGEDDTVSTNKVHLINVMNVSRTPKGDTCQGYGLELAMKVFDKSPRNSGYATTPNRIVIAVTDGEDHCPNRTQLAAKKLKEEYGAFFIGVGVGLACPYDKTFLTNLTSTIGTNKAYYDVSDYNAIKTVIDQIFSPLCDEFHSGCGPECKGFCGCGDCYCPSCDDTKNLCFNYACTARDGTSHGCQMKSLLTCPANNTCVTHECDGSSGSATCKKIEKCAEVEELNYGSCRTVTCVDGQCLVDSNDNICRKFANPCEEWKCAGENETATDIETGCLLVRNITKECEDKNKECLKHTCKQGQCYQEDTCKRNDTSCEVSTCTEGGNGYYCKRVSIENPYEENACDKYYCDPDFGWLKNESGSWDAAKCRNASDSQICRTFFCDPDSGCNFTEDEECLKYCQEKDKDCVDEATRNSTLEQCILGGCTAGEEINGNVTPVCIFNFTNCSNSSAADEAERLNAERKDVCYTIMCSFGVCSYVPVIPIPKNTSCQYFVCEGDRINGWNWVEYNSTEYDNCKSDACAIRHCDPMRGCVEDKDLCESNTNECFTFTCVNNSGTFECVNKSELRDYTCKFEYCDLATGKKHVDSKKLDEVCPNTNKCVEMICNSSGECEAVATDPPGNDPCLIYTCDNATGWKAPVPKCDDGKQCTDDTCTIDGVCRHSKHNCYNDIDMTDYPCFKAECKEGERMCVRKIKNGVFIDVCGNCIRDGVGDGSDSSLELTACTDAPEEPLMKESLAAATIAMVVLGAIVVGAAIAGSTVVGTKALLDRARQANNQSAQNNPLFEGNETEMSNPSFVGDS